MLFTPLVVIGGVRLNTLHHLLIRDHTLALRVGLEPVDHELKGVQQPACVPSTRPQQSLCVLEHHLVRGHEFIFGQGPIHEPQQHLRGQCLEDVSLATGTKGGNHFKGRILCRGTKQGHRPSLHCPQEAVLLGLGKPMDLIDEEHRPSGKHAIPFGGIQNGTHVLDTAVDGAETVEWPV